MASSINASTSGAGGVITTADNTGILNIQTANTTAVTVDASQRVGIGVTPNAWTTSNNTKALQISTLTSVYQAFTGSNFASNTYYNGTNDVYITTASAGKFAFDAGNHIFTWSSAASGTAGTTIAFTERMRIDSNGNVIIAGTSPYSSSQKLSIMPSTGSASIGLKGIAGDGAYILFNDTGGAAVESRLGHVTNINVFQARCGTTGGVQLTSGATSWSAISDERLKDIIEPIENAVEKVSTLRTVIGKYKDDEKEIRRPFLIAQDLQAVLPEAIGTTTQSKEDDTEYLTIAYTDTIPLLVAAIKEQQTIINDLKARVTALEAK